LILEPFLPLFGPDPNREAYVGTWKGHVDPFSSPSNELGPEEEEIGDRKKEYVPIKRHKRGIWMYAQLAPSPRKFFC
jgi:hypothetical protein